MSRGPILVAVVTTATAALATPPLRRLADRVGRTSLARVNFHGRPVTLAGGPAAVLAAALSACLSPRGAADGRVRTAAVVGVAAGAIGLLDDLVAAPGTGAAGADASADAPPAEKGLRGHLGALRSGRVSTGSVKLFGIGALALAAGATLARADGRRGAPLVAETVLRGGLIAASANAVNLFDLRPGRAGKVVALAALPLAVGGGAGAAAPLGAALASLPDDLAERSMLGDCGANGLGAMLGVAVSTRGSVRVRSAILGVLIGLNLLSERVSFSAVIARTQWLRWFDDLGRAES